MFTTSQARRLSCSESLRGCNVSDHTPRIPALPSALRLPPSAIFRWLLAFAPAILVLLYISPLRLHVPYHDSWAFVEQYQKWTEGHYGWREFFAPHNNHPSAPGK